MMYSFLALFYMLILFPVLIISITRLFPLRPNPLRSLVITTLLNLSDSVIPRDAIHGCVGSKKEELNNTQQHGWACAAFATPLGTPSGALSVYTIRGSNRWIPESDMIIFFCRNPHANKIGTWSAY